MFDVKNIAQTVIKVVVFALVPMMLFYLMEGYEHNAYEEVRPMAQIFNIFLFELIAWILFFIFGSGRVALRIEIGIAMVYGLINHYVMAFRSTPFVPWDIFSIETAASVAGNYDFTPTKEVIIVTGTFIILFILLQLLDLKFPYGITLRIIPVICVSLVLGVFVNLLWDEDFQSENDLYPFLFTPSYMTKVNGMAVTFAMDMAYVFVETPSGYSEKEAEEILASYEKTDDTPQGNRPNIIVIMNEAFSDLAVLGDFKTNEDYMPYVHSLQKGNENTITGELTVSVCGGNTANSEFEFLTGHTMDFFPVGSIPYQQYIKGELPSLASQLRDMGYKTYGMHPYNASGWCRNKVYPWLGFETSYFSSDFYKRTYIRDYISDRTAYDRIMDIYEAKEEGQPLFVFEVTMQNHSSYSELHPNFKPDIEVEGINNNGLEQYLSLMKVSDAELKRLITYFEGVEEDTIIVFFGDHQPSDYIANQILRLNGINPSKLTQEQAMLRYQVPYVVWANYDIDEASGADMDISFLAANVLEMAGIELTPYQNFLLEYEAVLAENDGSKEAETKVQKYKDMHQKLQYYYMFDYREE